MRAPDMTTTDLKTLREKAEAATSGPYKLVRGKSGLSVGVQGNDGRELAHSSWHECSPYYPTQAQTIANFEFFEAASPSTLLSLISELEQLRAEKEAMRKALEELLNACVREFGWQVGANSSEPAGDDPDCEITWGDLYAAHRVVTTASGSIALPKLKTWEA